MGMPGCLGCVTSADGCIGCRCDRFGSSVCETVRCGRDWKEDVGDVDADPGRGGVQGMALRCKMKKTKSGDHTMRR